MHRCAAHGCATPSERDQKCLCRLDRSITVTDTNIFHFLELALTSYGPLELSIIHPLRPTTKTRGPDGDLDDTINGRVSAKWKSTWRGTTTTTTTGPPPCASGTARRQGAARPARAAQTALRAPEDPVAVALRNAHRRRRARPRVAQAGPKA